VDPPREPFPSPTKPMKGHSAIVAYWCPVTAMRKQAWEGLEKGKNILRELESPITLRIRSPENCDMSYVLEYREKQGRELDAFVLNVEARGYSGCNPWTGFVISPAHSTKSLELLTTRSFSAPES
jgi:hypothetical protein